MACHCLTGNMIPLVVWKGSLVMMKETSPCAATRRISPHLEKRKALSHGEALCKRLSVQRTTGRIPLHSTKLLSNPAARRLNLPFSISSNLPQHRVPCPLIIRNNALRKHLKLLHTLSPSSVLILYQNSVIRENLPDQPTPPIQGQSSIPTPPPSPSTG